jgi:hypothetical protein
LKINPLAIETGIIESLIVHSLPIKIDLSSKKVFMIETALVQAPTTLTFAPFCLFVLHFSLSNQEHSTGLQQPQNILFLQKQEGLYVWPGREY